MHGKHTELLEAVGSNKKPKSSVIDIPVCYGDDAGEDLAEVMKITGFTQKQIIELHSQAEYTVGFLGFAPGFSYLLGLLKA